ncbi:DUF397 domain-containing protein [Streptomyces sp. bgisy034]|uniref:DUF397 domain-containing protein n=1 Tax=Streptomyces sp. bgisy034 TaxID=3413774 RepID=UPI003EB82485
MSRRPLGAATRTTPSGPVEVADHLPGTIPVRDSKSPEASALVFPTRARVLFGKSP